MNNTLRHSWLFRKRTNLMLGTLGVGSTVYLFLRYYQEQKFNHPLIKEVLRLMEQNQQVVELIGYPLDTKINLRSIFHKEKNNSANMFFVVVGPKGSLMVDAQASALSSKELNHGSEALKKQFYVPDKQAYEEMQEAKGDAEKLKEIKVNEHDKFWKLDSVFADLAGQQRISIQQREDDKIIRQKVPQKGKQQPQEDGNQKKTGTNHFEQQLVTSRVNGLDLWKEHLSRNSQEGIDLSTLSDAEQEEQRRFRLHQLYQKIGYVRIWLFGMVLVGGMGTYIYLMKNKRKSILNSQIHQESMSLIKKSSIAKNIFGQTIKFSTGVRGAQIDNEADFDMDIIGDKSNGIAKVKGTQNDNGAWRIQELIVEQKANDGKITITKKLL